jgi:hypothetical protein
MNLAANTPRGDVLIFHHADSVMTAAQRRRHPPCPARSGSDRRWPFIASSDARHPRLLWLETVGRFFTRHGGSFFGDQSVFVRRETFRALGGFAPIPLMEDMEFSRRLRQAGKVAVLDPPIASSGRRHQRRGAWRTSLQNGLFILLYKCGLSPRHLHRWYYREALSAPNEAVLIPPPLEELGQR